MLCDNEKKCFSSKIDVKVEDNYKLLHTVYLIDLLVWLFIFFFYFFLKMNWVAAIFSRLWVKWMIILWNLSVFIEKLMTFSWYICKDTTKEDKEHDLFNVESFLYSSRTKVCICNHEQQHQLLMMIIIVLFIHLGDSTHAASRWASKWILSSIQEQYSSEKVNVNEW